MSDIKKLLAIMNETTTSGSIAPVSNAAGNSMLKRSSDTIFAAETVDPTADSGLEPSPKVSTPRDFANWESSALAGKKKKKSKGAKPGPVKESTDQRISEGQPTDNDMGSTVGGSKMTLGQWKQMWMKKMPKADFASLFKSPPNMQGSAIAYFDGWMNDPDARWDPKQSVAEAGKGLWANIHAKQDRIKKGSGERMRKPGSKGAPTNKNFKDAASEGVDGQVDEGWKEKLAGTAIASAMALGAGGAHARVSGDQDPNINRLTGKPIATQQATDTAPAKAEAPRGFSKEYLQGVVDGKHPRPLISVERAKELLSKLQESDNAWGPQGRFTNDTYVNIGGDTVKKLQVGDIVTYFGQKAKIVDMPTKETSRITIDNKMGGTTKNVSTHDLKRTGLSEAAYQSQYSSKAHNAIQSIEKKINQRGLKGQLALEFLKTAILDIALGAVGRDKRQGYEPHVLNVKNFDDAKEFLVTAFRDSREQSLSESAYQSQYSSKAEAIEYAKDRVKTFRDPEDGIEIWKMPDGGFDVVATMNSNGRNHCISNGGKKLGTVGPRHQGVIEGLHPMVIDDVKKLATLNPTDRYSAYSNIRDYFKGNPELHKMASDLMGGYYEADMLRGKYKTAESKAKYAELEPMNQAFIKQALVQEQGLAEGSSSDYRDFFDKEDADLPKIAGYVQGPRFNSKQEYYDSAKKNNYQQRPVDLRPKTGKQLPEATGLSPETLANYKRKAGEDATASDKAGNTKHADKRFSGIVKATKKESDNDAKKVKEAFNNYHANRTGFARGQRDDERHDLDPKIPHDVFINDRFWKTFPSEELARRTVPGLQRQGKKVEVKQSLGEQWPLGDSPGEAAKKAAKQRLKDKKVTEDDWAGTAATDAAAASVQASDGLEDAETEKQISLSEADKELTEIDFSSELSNLSISDADIISNSKVIGTIGSRKVFLFNQGKNKIYFFTNGEKIDALVYILGDRLKAMKNFSSNSGLIYNLFQFIINIKKQSIRLASDDQLTRQGIEWVLDQTSRPNGFNITDAKLNKIDADSLFDEWEQARLTGNHGHTELFIRESKDANKIRVNEKSLMPHDIFGATLLEANNIRRLELPSLIKEADITEEMIADKLKHELELFKKGSKKLIKDLSDKPANKDLAPKDNVVKKMAKKQTKKA